MKSDELEALLAAATPEERAELEALLAVDKAEQPWRPLPGPQSEAYYSEADVIGYGGAAGGGKGLALDTPLATPTGWVLMCDVNIGDTLFDDTGQPCTVTAVSEVQQRPCFKLTFSDGQTLVADDVHRWTTTQERNGRRGVPSMVDTAHIARTLRSERGAVSHAITVASSIQCEEAALPITPYLLGAWLGDGTTANSRLTIAENEMVELVRAECARNGWTLTAGSTPLDYGVRGGMKVALRDIGVLGDKHIPTSYLRASGEQRLDLLQGLMDTDGTVDTRGQCEFSVCCKKLAEDFAELAWSLGIKGVLRESAAVLRGREVNRRWRFKFLTALPAFRLTRKAVRQKRSGFRDTVHRRYIISCEPVQSVPTRCIAVDSPSRLFLAGRAMIPTHNTDLAAGMIVTKHQRSLFIRREKAQTNGVVQRLQELIGTDGFSSQRSEWRLGEGKLLELGGLDNPGDERRWQGRPHDLKVFDEVTEQREAQVRFIMGWNRSNDPTLHCQTLMTFNPPTTAEGRWVIQFFGPWLDKKHPMYPTAPGVLLWVYMHIESGKQDTEVFLPTDHGPKPFILINGERVYDIPAGTKSEDIISPRSRTFIPARLGDNPYYMESGYKATLQAMPEPLRSQMLYGDFTAGTEDDPWQVVPTSWVEAAQARWREPVKLGEMLGMGVDVARGGRDDTAIIARHHQDGSKHWYNRPVVHPGKSTPNGHVTAALVLAERRNDAPIAIDVIGVGAAPYDILRADVQTLGVNVSEAPTRTTAGGALRFANLRTQLWWTARELLDPANNHGVCLPPDPRLLRELTTPKWSMLGKTVQVESREDIIKRGGKSPDVASALILAMIDIPKLAALKDANAQRAVLDYDPLAGM